MKILREVMRFWDECRSDNVTAYAAQSAYFTLLSLIPFLLFFGALLKYTPVSLEFLVKGVNLVLPDYIAGFLVSIIKETYASSVGILSIAGIAAIWSAAKGIQYLTNGLNMMYDLEETRSWLRLRFWAIIYTFIMIFSIVLMLVLLVFGRTLQNWLVNYVPAVASVTKVLLKLKSLIGIGGLTFIFALFYWAFPNRKGRGGSRITYLRQLPGAFICALAWYLFSFGVSIYVDYFHGFSGYGSLTTIALIMFWLYICMYILLVCAEVNNQYAEVIFRRLRRKK
jgi:membrane protein